MGKAKYKYVSTYTVLESMYDSIYRQSKDYIDKNGLSTDGLNVMGYGINGYALCNQMIAYTSPMFLRRIVDLKIEDSKEREKFVQTFLGCSRHQLSTKYNSNRNAETLYFDRNREANKKDNNNKEHYLIDKLLEYSQYRKDEYFGDKVEDSAILSCANMFDVRSTSITAYYNIYNNSEILAHTLTACILESLRILLCEEGLDFRTLISWVFLREFSDFYKTNITKSLKSFGAAGMLDAEKIKKFLNMSYEEYIQNTFPDDADEVLDLFKIVINNLTMSDSYIQQSVLSIALSYRIAKVLEKNLDKYKNKSSVIEKYKDIFKTGLEENDPILKYGDPEKAEFDSLRLISVWNDLNKLSLKHFVAWMWYLDYCGSADSDKREIAETLGERIKADEITSWESIRSEIYEMTFENISIVTSDIESLRNENSNLSNNLNKQVDKYKNLSDKYRDTNKKLDCANSEIKDLQNKIYKIEKEKSEFINQSDFDNLEKEKFDAIKKLEETTDKLVELERKLTKAQDDLKEANDELEDANTKLRDSEIKLSEANTRADEMALHKVYQEIPMESYVNLLKTKNIAIIGGDMMFEKLKTYGLDKIKYYKCGCRSITYNDISSVDLIVLCTAYLDHSSTGAVKNIINSHNMNYINFNNKNADLLIVEMFRALF